MMGHFGFGFNTDDIEDDVDEANITSPKDDAVRESSASACEPSIKSPQTHGLEDLVSTVAVLNTHGSQTKGTLFLFPIDP